MPIRAALAAARRAARDPVYANGVALVLNSALASALGFAFWLVVARRYSSADIGWGAAVVSAATLAALVGKAGFDACVIRYGPTASGRALKRLVAEASVASVLLTAGVALVVLSLAGTRAVSSLAPLRQPSAALGFLLLSCGTALAWIFDAFFIAEQSALYTLYRNVAFNLVKLAAPFAIAAVLAAYAVPLAWGAGLAVSVLVALLLVPLAVRRRAAHPARASDEAPPPGRSEMALYAAKNYVLNVSEFLPSQLLPILVLEAMGPVVNARFFLAWTIATVGFLGSKAIAQSAFAALVRDGPPQEALAKGAWLALALLGPFAIVMLWQGGLVLRLFGQGGHADAILMLRLLSISLAPLTAANLYLAFLKARRAGWELTLLPAATLLATVGLAPLALARGGIVALGWSWLVVQSIAGAYAAARLVAIIRRNRHDELSPTPRLGRHPHEG